MWRTNWTYDMFSSGTLDKQTVGEQFFQYVSHLFPGWNSQHMPELRLPSERHIAFSSKSRWKEIPHDAQNGWIPLGNFKLNSPACWRNSDASFCIKESSEVWPGNVISSYCWLRLFECLKFQLAFDSSFPGLWPSHGNSKLFPFY